MSDICGDNRFEVIAEAKKDLLESTNIEMSPEEMSVIDNILFRCWQMGWLRQYETYEFCASGENPCKEYDQEKHCCHRWTKVIRKTIEDVKNNQWIPVTEALPEECVSVLIQMNDGEMAVSQRRGMNYWDGYRRRGDIIAWMPLPEPYRGEE